MTLLPQIQRCALTLACTLALALGPGAPQRAGAQAASQLTWGAGGAGGSGT